MSYGSIVLYVIIKFNKKKYCAYLNINILVCVSLL